MENSTNQEANFKNSSFLFLEDVVKTTQKDLHILTKYEHATPPSYIAFSKLPSIEDYKDSLDEELEAEDLSEAELLKLLNPEVEEEAPAPQEEDDVIDEEDVEVVDDEIDDLEVVEEEAAEEEAVAPVEETVEEQAPEAEEPQDEVISTPQEEVEPPKEAEPQETIEEPEAQAEEAPVEQEEPVEEAPKEEAKPEEPEVTAKQEEVKEEAAPQEEAPETPEIEEPKVQEPEEPKEEAKPQEPEVQAEEAPQEPVVKKPAPSSGETISVINASTIKNKKKTLAKKATMIAGGVAAAQEEEAKQKREIEAIKKEEAQERAVQRREQQLREEQERLAKAILIGSTKQASPELGKFEIQKSLDAEKPFKFVLKTELGKVVFETSPMRTKPNELTAVMFKDIMANGSFAFFRTPDGYYFKILDARQRVFCTSKAYRSTLDAQKAAALIKKYGLSANYIDDMTE